MYGCKSWKLDAFEMKGLRKILRISWTANKTNNWVLNKGGVRKELLKTVKAKKLSYYGHIVRKKIMQGTMPGACRRRRQHTTWMDNIKTWTGLTIEESVRMAEDGDKWRKYVHGVANPWIKDGWWRCLLYTSPSPRDRTRSRMPSSA